MALLTFTEIDEDIFEAQQDRLDRRQMADFDVAKFGQFFIMVSGKHSVYFTLWHFKESVSAFANPLRFCGNLSIDLTKAVDKALEIIGSIPCEIDAPGTRNHLIGSRNKFTFGKYRGQDMGDVFVENPSYFAWLNRQITNGLLKLSAKNAEIVTGYATIYFQTLTKKNQEKETKYVGKVGQALCLEVEVTSSYDNGEYVATKMVDTDGNFYLSYKIAKMEKGVKFTLNAKVVKHVEKVGIKYTQVNYVKS